MTLQTAAFGLVVAVSAATQAQSYPADDLYNLMGTPSTRGCAGYMTGAPDVGSSSDPNNSDYQRKARSGDLDYWIDNPHQAEQADEEAKREE